MPKQAKTVKKQNKKNKKQTKKVVEEEEETIIELKQKETVKEEDQSEFLKAIKKEEDLHTTSGELDKDHKFWKTEPVTGTGVVVPAKYNNPIHPDIPHEKVSKVPIPLPNESMEFCIVDIDNEKEMDEVYILLKENYVEDDDATLRFDYQKDFIKWCLKVPGYYPTWFVGIRLKEDHALIGFITGIPTSVKIYDRTVDVAEINFLCVRKDMRKYKLAPKLIQEVTRQVHLTGLFQAVYTSGTELPNVIATAQYFHRPLNPKKLDVIGFSTLNKRLTLERALKLYKLPNTPASPGFREMEEKDVDIVTEKLNRYLTAHHDLTILFSKETIRHTFLSIDNIVKSYVVEQNGTVKAFAAFYILPSSILNSYEYDTLYVAYQYYFFHDKDIDYKIFFKDILAKAQQCNCDVFNCLNMSENGKYLADLLFIPGDGYLKYYLYNWACPPIPPEKLNIVLQ